MKSQRAMTWFHGHFENDSICRTLTVQDRFEEHPFRQAGRLAANELLDLSDEWFEHGPLVVRE